jgi:hypothetical protein
VSEDVASSVFPTFCHVNQYGEWGYRSLARMLAISAPLNVWAPSAAMLRSDASSITPEQFMQYVDSGELRVFAREPWLTGQSERADKWKTSTWDDEIDGFLHYIWKDDRREGVSPERRRVTGLPPASGLEWATKYLDERPREINALVRLLKSRRADSLLPTATLAATRTLLDSPADAAARLLQEAYNHGAAFRDTRSDAPFLLDKTDRTFLGVLAHAAASEPSDLRQAIRDAEVNADVQAGEVATQLVEVLRNLDIHAGRMSTAADMDQFLKGEGRDLLVRWVKSLCDYIRAHPTTTIDDYVLDHLRREVGGVRVANMLRQLLVRKDEMTAGGAGIALTVVDMLTSFGPLAMVGAAVTAYPVVKGLARELNYASVDFEGPQWPFLYTYGSKPTKEQVRKVKAVLAQLSDGK